MISARVSFGEIDCGLDFDTDHYSGEIAEDLAKRAAATVIGVHTVIATQQAQAEQ